MRSPQSPEPVGQRCAFARPTLKFADALPPFDHPRCDLLLHGRHLSAAGHPLRTGYGGFITGSQVGRAPDVPDMQRHEP